MAGQAAKHGRADLLQYFLQNCKPSDLEPRGMILLDAAQARSKPCVQLMLDQGLDINGADDMVGGVLHRALGSIGCTEDFLAWLIERGALVNHPEDNVRDQVHCLCRAVSHGTIPIMRLLVAAGADVDGSRALHYAVHCGYIDKAKYLVEKAGATVDLPNGVNMTRYIRYWYADAGATPLHVAAAHSQVAAAEYLLEKGADIEAKNAAGRTPLQEVEHLAAVQADLAEIHATKRTARQVRPLRWLFDVDHQEIVAFLKQRGAKQT
ncbi:putative ankyrin repeat domain [Diplodia seriata]|uniref:Putative ankyrin repeat domain n=1 Tax=Diplodia seriata TaxID=420778 RepID=A0A0G2FMW5_9PEZI|nr:putative ankyrin repeat domain [Diplodia seriata]